MSANATSRPYDLTGQVAVVTGGSRGIGRALVEALSAAGAAVAVVARSIEAIDATVGAISRSGGRAMGIAADVTDREAVVDMLNQVQSALGPIDILINNAGAVTPLGPVCEVDPDAWWRCQEVNVRGSMLCSRAVLPAMQKRGQGRIVNIVSMAGIMPLPNLSAYLVSKIALIRLSEVMALEAKPYGVLVFAVSPGTVRTEMFAELTDTPDGEKWTPWARHQVAAAETPVEWAASLVLSIASGEADQLSGRVLNARDNFPQVIAQASEVERDGLYALRIQTLQGVQVPIWDPGA
jgi:NAD(P)-dependent dehydrogenase (short-subunit alcohol dehydrogenase family)